MKPFRFDRIWAYFSFITFIVNFIAFVLIIALIIALSGLNVFPEELVNSRTALILGLIISFVTGTVISLIIINRILRPISELNLSMQKVVESDFSIQLNENQRIKEVNELYHSFNLMVQELGHIDTVQNDFISTISHEFKTPLSTIQGYVQLLQSDDLTEAERQEFLSYILSATRRLTTLIENILKVSKLENQEFKIDRQHYRLDEQIREAILLLQPGWEAKNISFNLNLNTTYIDGNEDLLHQVWTNLIDNAIKYNHEEGNIQIELSTLADKQIQFIIQDSGIGIAPDDQKLVFEKFYQTDTSRTSQGNGLGLPLVKRIIELHEGEILVQSIPDQGTKFTVTLPQNDAEQ